MSDDIVTRLRQIPRFADFNAPPLIEHEAADEIERLREKCDRQAMILRRLTPENFPDTYFICGEAGTKDINGLPEKILVVPAYGVDWNMTYQRTDKVFGPEW